jgi:prepilin-type N-terminal cleavage/methylation domain-containing protein
VENLKRKGFTLIELLVTIVIVGILAGSMMLLLGSSSASSEATRIVANLRTLKAAADFYFFESGEWPNQSAAGYGIYNIKILSPYLDKTPKNDFADSTLSQAWGTLAKNRFFVYVTGPGSDPNYSTSDYHIYVVANVSDDYADFEVRKKLASMSPGAGIYNGNLSENFGNPSLAVYSSNPSTISAIGNSTSNTPGERFLMMRVR